MPLSDYHYIRTIVKGDFSDTILIEDKKGNKLCAKIVHDASTETSPEAQMLLKNLDSPFLVPIHDCFSENRDFVLVVEYLSTGSLHHFIQEQQLTNIDIWIVTTQLVRGLHYLHERDIVHGNLKPRNVLLNSTSRPLRIKICDFGICRDLNVRSAKSMIGTVCFMAPEVLSGQRYDTAVDMWSLGILIYYLVHGQYPFNHFNEILLSEIPRSISEFGPIINRLLVRDPASRATAAELMMDPKIVEIYEDYIKETTIEDVVDLRRTVRQMKRDLENQSNLIASLTQQNNAYLLEFKNLKSTKHFACNQHCTIGFEDSLIEESFMSHFSVSDENIGVVKYLASNKGSNITLTENDLVATKTSCGRDNSFVAIQHPIKGKVVLTLLNFATKFETFIGFFSPYHLQTPDAFNNAHSLYLFNTMTQFFLVEATMVGPSNPGPISKGQQIIIELNNNQATFSVPSLGYSHTVTSPSDYVFGLIISDKNTSWKLSSS
ncbi:hypothetical protein RCL1_008272 [Eukaryota sp. TZLM3-RCL]